MMIVGHDPKTIYALMKILGMKVTQDRSKKLLWLSQDIYIEQLLERFNMHKAKPGSTTLAEHLKLSSSKVQQVRKKRQK